jgi:hypothetical protein
VALGQPARGRVPALLIAGSARLMTLPACCGGSGLVLEDRLRTHSTAGSGVIQACDVDPATRGRMAEIEKKTKRYPTNLTAPES